MTSHPPCPAVENVIDPDSAEHFKAAVKDTSSFSHKAQHDEADPTVLESSSSSAPKERQRRAICPRCERPSPRACLCAALPDTRIVLRNTHVLVLQHPHEIRRKNRSLFLAEFCLSPESITTIRTRRFLPGRDDNHDATSLTASLLGPERIVWLVFPHSKAKPLRQALADRRNQPSSSSSLLTIIFLDATWKFAAEMERASQFPIHTQYVALDAQDLEGIPPKRFDIRAPPSPQHLSTAESLALVLSKIEENPNIYETIIQPLDLMVSQWHSFANAKTELK